MVPPGEAGGSHCSWEKSEALGKESAVASPGTAQTEGLPGAQSEGSGTPSPSPSAATVEISKAVSFPGIVSMTAEVMRAVLVTSPGVTGATETMLTLAEEPADRFPR